MTASDDDKNEEQWGERTTKRKTGREGPCWRFGGKATAVLLLLFDSPGPSLARALVFRRPDPCFPQNTEHLKHWETLNSYIRYTYN